MKVYLVGGSVRDRMLGIPSRDNDYVVVGATHEEMMAKGFIAVGKDHRVYLHPVTREEYSLSETLSLDLARRDLTINAMAIDGDELIDKFNGLQDLRQKILRHVKEENFYDDPLRVYRVARFASQFPDFLIHDETILLMKKVSALDSFKLLDPERIFLEFRKALQSSMPTRFLEILRKLDALHVHMRELMNSDLEFLRQMASKTNDVTLRFASLFSHSDQESVNHFCERLKTPNEWKTAAQILVKGLHAGNLRESEKMLDLLYSVDAFRRPRHLTILLMLMKEQAALIERAYSLTRDVSIKSVPTTVRNEEIGRAIREKRLEILRDKDP